MNPDYIVIDGDEPTAGFPIPSYHQESEFRSEVVQLPKQKTIPDWPPAGIQYISWILVVFLVYKLVRSL